MLALFSFLPIILLVVLMTKTNALPSFKALPIVALLTYAIMIFVFKHDLRLVHANVIDGLLTAWTPIVIVWGAIFLFQTMEDSGAMSHLRTWLNSVSQNRVAQLMIVGWAFPFLIEGASGFGTPAALAAPVLVGLGFNPLSAAIMVLAMNSVPVSFGAIGTPTWFGFSELSLTQQSMIAVGIKSAWFHALASLIIPVLALRFLVDWKDIRANLGFIYISLLSTVIPYTLVAYVSYEFPSLVGGMSGLVVSVYCAKKKWGLKKENTDLQLRNSLSYGDLIRSTFPLWGTVLVLIVTRVPQLGIKSWLVSADPMVRLGSLSVSRSLVVRWESILGTDVSWSHKLLYVPSFIPFVVIALMTAYLFRMSLPGVNQVLRRSIDQMKLPAVALLGALVFVKLMMMGGQTSAVKEMGLALSGIGAAGWAYFAPLLGALGSFFSGSNTISNLTFGPIQANIAHNLKLDPLTILALQSVGGAMGNMVCIHNIVAVCSILGLSNKEGYILKRTVRILVVYALVVALQVWFLTHF